MDGLIHQVLTEALEHPETPQALKEARSIFVKIFSSEMMGCCNHRVMRQLADEELHLVG